jgi:hypothetical protein
MAKHVNNGKCDKCKEILNKFPGIHPGLIDFFTNIQTSHPDCHVSSGGRGKKEQEQYFLQGSSKAHYGQSAHNVNCAIDVFFLGINGAEWPKDKFESVIGSGVDNYNKKGLDHTLGWYGKKGAAFYELPHIQIDQWKQLVKDGKFSLVEKE